MTHLLRPLMNLYCSSRITVIFEELKEIYTSVKSHYTLGKLLMDYAISIILIWLMKTIDQFGYTISLKPRTPRW